MNIKIFSGMVRANFLPVSILPFASGVLLAMDIRSAPMDPVRLIAGFLAVAFAHMGANALNNYYDHKSGADSEAVHTTPFFGGSKLICSGALLPSKVLFWACGLLTLSACMLIGLSVLAKDFAFIYAGFFFLFLAAQYTAPPLKLAYRALGELVIFLLFGLFLVPAGFYLASGSFSSEAVMLSLPMAFLIFAVIFVNEVPDRLTDRASGKRNLTALVKVEFYQFIYYAVLTLSALALAANVIAGILPRWVLSGFALYVIAALLCRGRLGAEGTDAGKMKICCASQSILHLCITLLIITGLIL